jgi:hypothetical protein
MNLLQRIPVSSHGLVFGTLNPPFEPCPDTVIGEFVYAHPLITNEVSEYLPLDVMQLIVISLRRVLPHRRSCIASRTVVASLSPAPGLAMASMKTA